MSMKLHIDFDTFSSSYLRCIDIVSIIPEYMNQELFYTRVECDFINKMEEAFGYLRLATEEIVNVFIEDYVAIGEAVNEIISTDGMLGGMSSNSLLALPTHSIVVNEPKLLEYTRSRDIKSEDISTLKASLDEQVSVLEQRVSLYRTEINSLSESGCFTGEAADAIFSYLREVHLGLLDNLINLFHELIDEIGKFRSTIIVRINEDGEFILKAENLEELIRQIEKDTTRIQQTINEYNYAVGLWESNVHEIPEINKPRISRITPAEARVYYELKNELISLGYTEEQAKQILYYFLDNELSKLTEISLLENQSLEAFPNYDSYNDETKASIIDNLIIEYPGSLLTLVTGGIPTSEVERILDYINNSNLLLESTLSKLDALVGEVDYKDEYFQALKSNLTAEDSDLLIRFWNGDFDNLPEEEYHAIRVKVMLTLALAAEGYMETGDNGTIFGSFFPTKQGVAWCSMFVCYNMIMSGMLEESNSIIDGFNKDNIISEGWAGVDLLRQDFTSAGLYQSRESGYIPNPGDLIVFDEHIGIVVEVDDEYVYSVEGNAGNQVIQKHYEKDFYGIIGYCTTGSSSVQIDSDIMDSNSPLGTEDDYTG